MAGLPMILRKLSLIAIAVLVFAWPAHAEKRVALVIGNSDYTAVGKLANPVRDATSVAGIFRKLGFADVTLVTDLSKASLERALVDFTDKAHLADWAVVYYAGHGMEVDGRNYLIPVDARLKQDRHVRLETVPLDAVLDAAGAARKFRLVILDACRNNPFLAKITRSSATRSMGRGLARIEPTGTLVAYAARHGQVALDGDGENSPYVSALIKHMQEPNTDIRLMFSKVRDTVMAATNQQQQPFTYGSLPGVGFYFNPVSQTSSTPQTPAPDSTVTAAERAWERIKDTTDTAILEAFIEQFDGSFYAVLARARLKELGQTDVAVGVFPQSETPPQETVPSSDTETAARCDRLAGDRSDPQSTSEARTLRLEQIPTNEAIEACDAAVAAHPDEARLAYQLGRAVETSGDIDRALDLYRQALELGSAAAANNLGRLAEDNGDLVDAASHFAKAAELGHHEAITGLADVLLDLDATRRAPLIRVFDTSIEKLKGDAEAGDAVAMFVMGLAHEHGHGLLKHRDLAGKWYQRSAEKDHPRAMYRLALLAATSKDERKELLERAIGQTDDPEAIASLAEMQDLGVRVDGDPDVAWRSLKDLLKRRLELAEAGNAFAMTEVAEAYEKAEGTEYDGERALKWYRSAADTGHLPAAASLASSFNWNGIPPTGKDLGVATRYTEVLAKRGRVDSMYILHGAYQLGGPNLVRDPDLADRWSSERLKVLRQRARNGNLAALIQLAETYNHGNGVAEDDFRARDYYERAAKAGSWRAALELETFYREGKIAPKDEAAADQWEREARMLMLQDIELGSLDAAGRLATSYRYSDNFAEAVKWYEAEYNGEDSYSTDNAVEAILEIYGDTESSAHDPDRAAAWEDRYLKHLIATARAGYEDSFYYISSFLEKRDRPEDAAQAQYWKRQDDEIDQRRFRRHRRQAERGHPDSMKSLASVYLEGRGTEKDRDAALRWYQRAADAGLVNAFFSVAEVLVKEKPGRNDVERARSYLRRALEAGETQAHCDLGKFQVLEEIQSKDPDKAHEHFRKCREAGHSIDEGDIGELFSGQRAFMCAGGTTCYHVTTRPDAQRAVYWYRLAAPTDYHAAYDLAELYSEGKVVAQDFSQARKWYRRSAELEGWVLPMHKLAQLLRHGLGGPKEPETAVKWFERAAERGHAESRYAIALMYDKGDGIGKDPAMAARTLLKSVSQKFDISQFIVVIRLVNNSDHLSAATIREMQKVLRDEGHYTGSIDGIMGKGTKGAIDAYRDKRQKD